MSDEKDYVLGTHDEELDRLGLQHRVWRPRALDAWRRAGFTVGQTILDVGCGPGYASLDLAEIVGPQGQVLAIDQSERFLSALRKTCRQRGLANIEPTPLDLDKSDMPSSGADGAWARWVFSFVLRPREVLARVAAALKSGGTLVLHEYFDYATWRMAPRCPELEEFVDAVMQSWRAEGGEPDIALALPQWLAELGFEVKAVKPLVEVVAPSNFVWEWPAAFVQVGLKRLVQLGRLSANRSVQIAQAVDACRANPHSLMITPAVLEIIATKR